MELKDWQNEAYGAALSADTTNIMIIAGQQEGKTTLLSQIQAETGAPIIDGITASGEEVLETVENADSLVLMDEGGAYRYYRQLTQALENNPEIKFVVATLPQCPSMMMVSPHFTVIQATNTD